MVEEFKKYLCSEEDIREGTVTVGGEGNLEASTECIEVVMGGGWEEALTEEHGAETWGEIDVSPAVFLFHSEKAHIECGVMCDEGGVMRKGEEFRENGHNGRGIP